MSMLGNVSDLFAEAHLVSWAVVDWCLFHWHALDMVMPSALSLIGWLRLDLDCWQLSCLVLTIDSSWLSNGWLTLIVILLMARKGLGRFELAWLDAIVIVRLPLNNACTIKDTPEAWCVIWASHDSQVALTWRGHNPSFVLRQIVSSIGTLGCCLSVRLNSRSGLRVGSHARFHQCLTTGWIIDTFFRWVWGRR